MLNIIEPYILSFVAIFVAVDALGNVPIFASLAEGMNKAQRRKVVIDSVSTATLVAVIFMFLGKIVLSFIGITITDFQIAGGSLLFILATGLLLPGSSKGFLANNHDKDVGVFPLGTPLITGPAVLTTILMMRDSYGTIPTFAALIANMLITWLTLHKSGVIIKVLGITGSRAFAKIMYILLAAIGVMMVRKGVMGVILSFNGG